MAGVAMMAFCPTSTCDGSTQKSQLECACLPADDDLFAAFGRASSSCCPIRQQRVRITILVTALQLSIQQRVCFNCWAGLTFLRPAPAASLMMI